MSVMQAHILTRINTPDKVVTAEILVRRGFTEEEFMNHTMPSIAKVLTWERVDLDKVDVKVIESLMREVYRMGQSTMDQAEIEELTK